MTRLDELGTALEELGRQIADALEGHGRSPFNRDRCATVADGLMAIAGAIEELTEALQEKKKSKFEPDPEEVKDPMGLRSKKGGRPWRQ